MNDDRFFLKTGSKILGPLSMAQIESLQARGRLKAEYVISKDKKTWQSVDQFFFSREEPPAFLPESLSTDHQELSADFLTPRLSPSTLTMSCPYCAESISIEAKKCRHCGEFLDPSLRAANQMAQHSIPTKNASVPPKSDAVAGCLGFLLGPVGLWYKGQWAAGFAWIVMAFLMTIATGGVAAPVFWIGMGLHAMVAKTKE